MDSIIETTENFIVERGNSIDIETRQDLEVDLMGEMSATKIEFSEAMKKIIDGVPGEHKYLDMVAVQVKLARTLWCFDQLSNIDDGNQTPDLAANHRQEMEEAIRRLIFDPTNRDSWVNVRGSKNADLCGKELYGVVSTLAFLNLMKEVDPDYASGAKPSQLFSSPRQDVFNKVDIVIKKNGQALLLQLKSGDRVEIDPIPFESNGSFSSSSMVGPNEKIKMVEFGHSLLRSDPEISEIKIAAVRVPSLVNGQIRSVDVFGGIRDDRLITDFKSEAKLAGII